MSGIFGGFGISLVIYSAAVYFARGLPFEAAVVLMLAGLAFLLASIAWNLDTKRGPK